jgi:hypothetical protein
LSTAVLALSMCAASALARADDGGPLAPRVYHVPTAWLRPHASVTATVGANHRGGAIAAVVAGLGDIAEVDVAILDHVVACAVCGGDDRETAQTRTATALFKLGLGPGRLARWQPAAALGFRRSLGGLERQVGGSAFDPELAQIYLVFSWRVSRLELHLGGELWDATSRPGGLALDDLAPSEQVRPFAGASWRSRRYPRTSLLLDVAWVPELRDPAPQLTWLAGFGVRYQALSWASVELAVRGRERDAENLTAFLRFNVGS